MVMYRYRGRALGGGLVEGKLHAGNKDAAFSQLNDTGITPLSIEELVETKDALADLGAHLLRGEPTLSDMLLFCRQMATMARAGIPIVRGLSGIAQSSHNPIFAEQLREIQAALSAGTDLSTALTAFPKTFSPLFVAMVRVGENTGRLEEAFTVVGGYLTSEKATLERVTAALRYPTIVLVFMAVSIGILNTMVIPAFAKVFLAAKVSLPWATRLLIAVSDFFVGFWPGILAALIFGFVAARSFIATPAGRQRWDREKLRLPIIGSILFRSSLARFAGSMAMTLRAGLPLLQALTLVARAVDNEYIGAHILTMRNGVERGDSLTKTATDTGMFSPLVLQMLAIGEEAGALDDLLREVATFYEQEVDVEVKNLSAAIEPLLIVILAVLVLILALGIFLPLWDLATLKRV
jgi:MSHA biogenesis protein MshG